MSYRINYEIIVHEPDLPERKVGYGKNAKRISDAQQAWQRRCIKNPNFELARVAAKIGWINVEFRPVEIVIY